MMNAYTSRLSRKRLVVVLACLCLAPADASAEVSWAFAPGAYTHSPESGQRVVQYAQHDPVEGLPDPRQTVSRYWRTRTNLRGVDGSSDSIYEVRSFGNTLGGFDAQRERGYDAQLQTLDALTPFRHNPYLFFGGMQGFGYGYPGYPAAVPGMPANAQSGYAPGYGPQGGYAPQNAWAPPMATPQAGIECEGEGCAPAPPAYTPTPGPYPGMPGTAWPYQPQTGFVAPMPYPFPFYGYGFGNGYGYDGDGPHGGGRPRPWSGHGPGRQSHYQGGGW